MVDIQQAIDEDSIEDAIDLTIKKVFSCNFEVFVGPIGFLPPSCVPNWVPCAVLHMGRKGPGHWGEGEADP